MIKINDKIISLVDKKIYTVKYINIKENRIIVNPINDPKCNYTLSYNYEKYFITIKELRKQKLLEICSK